MAELKTIPAVEARIHLGDIMRRVFQHGERFVVERSGLPMVVILNANDYRELVQEREERFKVLDQIRAKLPTLPAEDVARDVRDAVRAVRKRRA
ncbi:MAG: type II toxin-antitoxin system prevent-host-death family antitoxin [Candidatus Omnitrophica bacterium]|nr:type II toxin-antitoxin system prevent-host-death family antitoxin [Candidatus Omnitrophota bacterium]